MVFQLCLTLWLRNSIMSIFFDFSLLLLSDTSWPAFENSLSEGTEDPGTQRYFLASIWSLGNRNEFCCHHDKGLVFLSILPSSKYRLSSIIESVVELLLEFDSATLLSNEAQRSLELTESDSTSAALLSMGTADCGLGMLASSLVIRRITVSRAEWSQNGNFLNRGSSKVVMAVM